MAKKSKSKIKKTGTARKSSERRSERRFVPHGSASGNVVKGAGGLAALLLGAGAWAYVWGKSFAEDDQLKSLPSYLVAGGAVLLGIAIWLGTSTDSAIRVGSPGIAQEKGEIRRMPWWAISKITFEPGALAVLVAGKDEANVDWNLKLSLKNHAEAIGWLVREAQERIPRRLDIAEETLEKLPGASDAAGEKIELEPLQVVGKRCAATGKTISYEPDARVCARCERVYAKDAVPKKCKCGNSLAHLQGEGASDESVPDSTREHEEETAEG